MLSFYTNLKSLWWRILERLHPGLHRTVFRYRMYVKYLIAGSTAAGVNLLSILLFVEVLGTYYLLGSALAFILGFITSFILQKFFTFGDTTLHVVHRQLALYFGIALGNLGLNTILVFVFVEFLGVWYFLSQMVASVLIAVASFYLYKRFVFI